MQDQVTIMIMCIYLVGNHKQNLPLKLPIAMHDNCPLLSHLLMNFGDLHGKQYELRSDSSFGSSLIRVHSVCSCDKLNYSGPFEYMQQM